MKTLKNILFFLLVLPASAMSEVNLIEGSFRILRSHKLGQFDLIRAYSSRSLNRGLFGFGWCSNLEVKLTSIDDQAEIDGCPLQSKLVFQTPNTQKNVDRFISSLQTPKPTQQSQSYFSLQKGQGTLQKNMNGWIWTKLNSEVYEFNLEGQISSYISPKKELWTFIYGSQNKLIYLRNMNGHQLRLNYEGEHLKSIHWLDNKLELTHQRQNLSSVKINERAIEKYNYDSLNNVTSMFPAMKSGVTEANYDHLDRIVNLKFSNKCEQLYSYQSASSENLEVVTTYKCPNQVSKAPTKYLFHFNRDANQNSSLSKIEINSGSQQKQFDIDNQTGRALSQRKGASL